MINESAENVLEIKDLCLEIKNKKKNIPILNQVTVSAERGRVLGIAGESGAGKSMTVYAVAGLLSDKNVHMQGEIFLDGRQTLEMRARERQKFCAKKIALIPQDSIHALNPYEKIGAQMYAAATFWKKCSRKEKGDYLKERLELFGIRGGEQTLQSYPHELSGGMRQRVAISMALESDADILIADEPTTSLDVINQFQFLEFLQKVWQERKLTVIYVSHDLPLLGKICDDLLIMKDGMCIEHGTKEEVFFDPKTEYTKLLMQEAKKIS